jgi:hypothetical protein
MTFFALAGLVPTDAMQIMNAFSAQTMSALARFGV